MSGHPKHRPREAAISTDPFQRPHGSCLTCRPPFGDRAWPRADDGYCVCHRCVEQLRAALREVAERFGMLDPMPGGGAELVRGAPGFGSRSPGSDHILCMRDKRSKADACVWVGGDGRIHREPTYPPLSVCGVLEDWALDVVDARGFAPLRKPVTVAQLCTWLDNQLDWIAKQDCVVEFHRDILLLIAQLKPVTGGGQKAIAICPRVNDGRPCRAKLYEPDRDGVIACPRCFYEWPREKWLELGEAS